MSVGKAFRGSEGAWRCCTDNCDNPFKGRPEDLEGEVALEDGLEDGLETGLDLEPGDPGRETTLISSSSSSSLSWL